MKLLEYTSPLSLTLSVFNFATAFETSEALGSRENLLINLIHAIQYIVTHIY